MTTLLSNYNAGDYSVLEINFLAARKTGQVRAQLPLNSDDFATDPAQNGMLLTYDQEDGSVKLPAAKGDYALLHFSIEKLYNEKFKGDLASYAVKPGGVYPRLFVLNSEDTFTTDAVMVDDNLGDDYIKDHLDDCVGKYYTCNTSGFIEQTDNPTDPGTIATVLKCIASTDMPASDFGVTAYGLKFKVIRAVAVA